MQFRFRASEERGGDDHGWLKTFHTFSFADYYDRDFVQYGPLRVINEDRVFPGQGFPFHRHQEAEIFSYILSGELSHKDTMGNVETMKRGDVQMTSGGTGIAHSEYNDHPNKEVHFLQIWARPSQRALKPQYYTRHFTDADKKDKFAHIVAPVGYETVKDVREADGPTPVHAPLHFFTSLLSPKADPVTHTVLPRFNPVEGSTDKLVYLQVVQSSGYSIEASKKDGSGALIKVIGNNGQETILGEGDGVFVDGAVEGDVVKVENIGEKVAEVILFDMDA
ncbi:hypothetical protein TREMEDRAFT_34070 [Tremella mesenterica DSM 1558]|uniref:uncharacterized protein n=1 Tax=Tremella mesenterica (strain ATCC 24925 / CBS 8224 / DSM 1558 / NBRC 9311 / NRRL Y-6157 / RJB 2259-6 / UBC 559-6) TaxID=578456 RepID=UPI0003F4996D|nr:uncharacterized protein TREMEDRAFT_34070 [Tremella mesenterica DSM 1558]EIW67146.1 hypothetical protein TREMEDRAFT_34070 [Tremella mesenterica DSM 1558]